MRFGRSYLHDDDVCLSYRDKQGKVFVSIYDGIQFDGREYNACRDEVNREKVGQYDRVVKCKLLGASLFG